MDVSFDVADGVVETCAVFIAVLFMAGRCRPVDNAHSWGCTYVVVKGRRLMI